MKVFFILIFVANTCVSMAADQKAPVSVKFKLGHKVVLDTSDIKNAYVTENPEFHEVYVSIQMTLEATQRFKKITKDNIGKTISIIVDGKVLSSPVVRAEIGGGNAQIDGHFSKEEADKLVQRINDSKK